MGRKRTLIGLAVAAALALGAVACSSDGSEGSGPGTDGGDATSTTEPAGDGGAENTVPPSAASLPEGFPAELAPPADVVTLVDASEPSPGSYFVRGEVAGADLEAVHAGLQAQLTEAGYDIVGSTYTPDEAGGGIGNLSAVGPDHTVSATFGPDDTTQTDDVFLVQLSVAPVAD